MSDHETVFENRATRLERGAAVDEAYMPLSSSGPAAAGTDMAAQQCEIDIIRNNALSAEPVDGRGSRLLLPAAPAQNIGQPVDSFNTRRK